MVVSDEEPGAEAAEQATPRTTAVDDGGTLGGAVPPAKTDRSGSEESERERDQKDLQPRHRISQVLASWGPWKRLAWYRETQRVDRQSVWCDRDPEENERGRLPPGEKVQLPAIWVAEVYTPSNVEGLLRGISVLGWEHGRIGDDSLLKWMSEVRQGRRAGWTSLGLVCPPSEAHFMRERSAVLPNGVRAALPILMSLTPSVYP